jgi:DNA-directed RNA polymerase subunit RPC12/RpoP
LPLLRRCGLCTGAGLQTNLVAFTPEQEDKNRITLRQIINVISSMQQAKCPNCGANIPQPIAEDYQENISVNCSYCGSPFAVKNPNYSPEAEFLRDPSLYDISPVAQVAPPPPQKTAGSRFRKIMGWVLLVLFGPASIRGWYEAIKAPSVVGIIAAILLTVFVWFFFTLTRDKS